MGLNGILAGLVGITANADIVTIFDSILIGGIAGGLVVGSIIFLDKAKIDDPVGAISVHGVCGIWGTLACAIFGDSDFMVQLIGAVSVRYLHSSLLRSVRCHQGYDRSTGQ